jgi:hypothetical protein
VSVEATNWVLNDAPDVPPHLVSTLFGLANHAHADGRNAYISKETLSRYTRKAPRNVQKDLRDLEELGLIVLGDQRVVEHYRADKRPIVYNLAVWLKRDGEMHTSSRAKERGDAGRHAGRCTVQSGEMQASPKPKEEPKEEPKENTGSFVAVRASAQTPPLDQDSTVDDIEQVLGKLDASEAGRAQGMLEQGKHPRYIYNTLKRQREAA